MKKFCHSVHPFSAKKSYFAINSIAKYSAVPEILSRRLAARTMMAGTPQE